MVVPEPKQNFSDNHDNNNNNMTWCGWRLQATLGGMQQLNKDIETPSTTQAMANATRISIGLHLLRNCANT
jgi:hypothetical protein